MKLLSFFFHKYLKFGNKSKKVHRLNLLHFGLNVPLGSYFKALVIQYNFNQLLEVGTQHFKTMNYGSSYCACSKRSTLGFIPIIIANKKTNMIGGKKNKRMQFFKIC